LPITTLLSIVPLLILILIALSEIIDQGALLTTLGAVSRVADPGTICSCRRRTGPLPASSRVDWLGANGEAGIF
jgi:hypothetical protein